LVSGSVGEKWRVGWAAGRRRERWQPPPVPPVRVDDPTALRGGDEQLLLLAADNDWAERLHQRAQQVMGESIELLERIVDDSLLGAIADGTFGITRRPADGGKGLDGVVAHADGYYNPATELLEEERA